ncbi:hypothetical protein [Nonomuraea recticatena]|uniref:Uncharacterized protein n=1 Tax=Nonomuraea recticatena TaxID=46178 RepID=A0ABP6DNV4_9ACTN
MHEVDLDDGIVRLEPWGNGDAAWYAEAVRDPLIQRFTTDPPTLDAAQVLTAMLARADAACLLEPATCRTRRTGTPEPVPAR